MSKNQVCYDWIESISQDASKKGIFQQGYWAAEWSWSPICDGIYSCEEVISYRKTYEYKDKFELMNTVSIYKSKSNYRTYLGCELFDTKSEADIACSHFNAWGYDYDICKNEYLKWLDENARVIEESGHYHENN